MPQRHRLFTNREWVARGVVVLAMGALIATEQWVHIKPPVLVKPPAKPLKITLAAPEPEPVPVPPTPPQPVEPPPPPPPPEPTPVEPPPPPVPTPAPQPVEPPPPPPKPVEKPKKPVEKPKPVKHVHHEKKQPPKPEAKPEPVQEPAPEKPVAPAPAPVKPVAPPAPPAPASNPSHEAAYVSEVRRQIEHHKVYPALARRLDMSGTVEVAYVLDRQGKLLSVKIVTSSGSDILDKAALQAVRSALFPPIPEDAWRGDAQKQFRTSLVYSLSDN